MHVQKLTSNHPPQPPPPKNIQELQIPGSTVVFAEDSLTEFLKGIGYQG